MENPEDKLPTEAEARDAMESYLDDLATFANERAKKCGVKPITVIVALDPSDRGLAIRSLNSGSKRIVQTILQLAFGRSLVDPPDEEKVAGVYEQVDLEKPPS